MEKKVILFLCTGNTCRSPMAEGYLQKLLDDRDIKSFEVRSAGVMTITGLLATQETIQILDSVGVDLRKHRSRPLTPDILSRADIVMGMTSFHTQSALRMDPEAKDKIFLLKEFTGSDPRHSHITDPMGCTLEVYKRVFNEIRTSCNKIMRLGTLMGVKLTPPGKKVVKRSEKPKKKTTTAKKKKAPSKPTKKKTTVKKKAVKKTRKKSTSSSKKRSQRR